MMMIRRTHAGRFKVLERVGKLAYRLDLPDIGRLINWSQLPIWNRVIKIPMNAGAVTTQTLWKVLKVTPRTPNHGSSATCLTSESRSTEAGRMTNPFPRSEMPITNWSDSVTSRLSFYVVKMPGKLPLPLSTIETESEMNGYTFDGNFEVLRLAFDAYICARRLHLQVYGKNTADSILHTEIKSLLYSEGFKTGESHQRLEELKGTWISGILILIHVVPISMKIQIRPTQGTSKRLKSTIECLGQGKTPLGERFVQNKWMVGIKSSLMMYYMKFSVWHRIRWNKYHLTLQLKWETPAWLMLNRTTQSIKTFYLSDCNFASMNNGKYIIQEAAEKPDEIEDIEENIDWGRFKCGSLIELNKLLILGGSGYTGFLSLLIIVFYVWLECA